MKSESEIRNQIKKIETDFEHVLDCYPASPMINAPRALIQIDTKSKLDTLYWILNEQRPKFKCDDFEKLDY